MNVISARRHLLGDVSCAENTVEVKGSAWHWWSPDRLKVGRIGTTRDYAIPYKATTLGFLKWCAEKGEASFLEALGCRQPWQMEAIVYAGTRQSA